MKVRDWFRAKFLPCKHPPECRDRIFNGAWIVDMCGLCGECFDMQKPTKGD